MLRPQPDKNRISTSWAEQKKSTFFGYLLRIRKKKQNKNNNAKQQSVSRHKKRKTKQPSGQRFLFLLFICTFIFFDSFYNLSLPYSVEIQKKNFPCVPSVSFINRLCLPSLLFLSTSICDKIFPSKQPLFRAASTDSCQIAKNKQPS